MEKNILLIGKTGSGKSTLTNVITGTHEFEESSGTTSKTREIKGKKIELEGLVYQIIDTVGIGDTQLTSDEVLDKIAEAVYLARSGISQIFFTVKSRLDPYQAEIYNILKTVIFDEHSADYTTIVRTDFSKFQDENETKKDVDLILSSKDNISEIARECKEKFVHVNNPPLDISCDECEKKKENSFCRCLSKIKKSEKNREESKKILLKYLSENCWEVFYKPPKLQALSNDIVNDYSDYLRKKEELQKELEKLGIEKELSLGEVEYKWNVSHWDAKNSQWQGKKDNDEDDKSYGGTAVEVNNAGTIDEEKKEQMNKNPRLKAEEAINDIEVKGRVTQVEIKKLESKKEKLLKEITEKEKIIRQKVRNHILNNYAEINKIQGGDSFIDSIIEDWEIKKRNEYTWKS